MDSRFPLMLMLALATAAPVAAGTENGVKDMVETGQILPLKPILERVQSEVRGDYVGFEFYEASLIYRFRFVDNGNVINVDIDARTGKRVRRTANY
jgi:uncharacterized membrane protein YkoI